jgi:hypothetical protein
VARRSAESDANVAALLDEARGRARGAAHGLDGVLDAPVAALLHWTEGARTSGHGDGLLVHDA